jgi:hypothetical protein
VKTLILIFLSALLFLGNIGIPVFTHACEEDGIFTSFFINQENHCSEERSDLPPCCQKEKKKNCCHDEKTVVQLDEKYVVTHAFSLPLIQYHLLVKQPQTVVEFLAISIQTPVINWVDPPPIWKSGKDILIQHSVFRI